MQPSEPYVKIGQTIEQRLFDLNRYKDEHGHYPEDAAHLSEDERKVLREYRDSSRKYQEMKEARGARYDRCTLMNYECSTKEQTNVVNALKEHVKDVESVSHRNVVLFGPKGTGKDHLLSGMAAGAFYFHGLTTMWRQGIDLHEKLRRDAFDEYRIDIMSTAANTERGTPILWISDPLPPSGGLTEFQQSQLFALIDRRYSDMKPTWISMNVSGGSEAEMRMGAQVVDRLKHDALVLHCNWESYRKPAGPS